MNVEEKFYLLVIDEFRSQPQLAEEIHTVDLVDYGTRFAGVHLDEALDLIARGERSTVDGLGFSILHELGPEPEEPPLEGLEVSRVPGRGQAELYGQLCRHALVHLLWKNFAAALDKINQAKYMRDEWAFAHYALGLLRGLDGDLGRAHFELYLAVNREPLFGAKQRIERALGLVR